MERLEILEEATRIARAAGRLLLEFVGESLDVRLKGDVNLVTRADHASEELIVSAIRRGFPTHGILAEEGGRAPAGAAAERLWVVDPLDGTTNFAHGLPLWSVSIGVCDAEGPEIGVVYDPSRDECFTAARGHGARLDGVAIRVSETGDLGRALLVTGFPYDIRTSEIDNLDHFTHFMKRCRAVRRLGSAALDLAYIACGRFDGFWELKLHPWDVAAGVLLVEEAGGRVTRFGGEPFDIHSNEIVAGPEPLLEAMRGVLALGRRAAPPSDEPLQTLEES
jgi:myo-inositol-1(or 4)-monophosphatase